MAKQPAQTGSPGTPVARSGQIRFPIPVGLFLYYAFSDEFSLWWRENELYTVLGILRQLGAIVTQAQVT